MVADVEESGASGAALFIFMGLHGGMISIVAGPEIKTVGHFAASGWPSMRVLAGWFLFWKNFSIPTALLLAITSRSK